MKIAVDVRPLVYPGTGNAIYLYHILKALLEISEKKWKWLFISNKAIHSDFFDLIQENTDLIIESSINPLYKIGPIWFHLEVPKILKKHQANLFWSTLFLLPYDIKKFISIPTILNIHDLNAWVAPHTMKRWNEFYLKLFTKNSLMNADEILCLSNTTKEILLEVFQEEEIIKNKNFHVIYPGIIIPPQQRKKPLQLPQIHDFYLSVGTLEPRKNFETLIYAYIEAKKELPYLPPLVIAGKSGWKMNETLKKLSKNMFKNHEIYFINAPTTEELFWLYENCTLFLFPSIYEGFGLPILEAGYFKKPQILSEIKIFKEIGSFIEGITYISEPKNIDLWKQAILAINKRKKSPIKNTKIHHFDYKTSAEKVLKIIEKNLN